MTTKEKILEQFDEDFKDDNGELVEPTFKDPVGDFCPVRQFLSQALDQIAEETRKETLFELGRWTADWVNKYCNTCGRLIVCHSSKIVDYCEKCGRLLETLDKPI